MRKFIFSLVNVTFANMRDLKFFIDPFYLDVLYANMHKFNFLIIVPNEIKHSNFILVNGYYFNYSISNLQSAILAFKFTQLSMFQTICHETKNQNIF